MYFVHFQAWYKTAHVLAMFYMDLEKKTKSTTSTKQTWFLNKKMNTLIVHPEDDQDPQEERDDVDIRVDLVLQGQGVGVGREMQHPPIKLSLMHVYSKFDDTILRIKVKQRLRSSSDIL